MKRFLLRFVAYICAGLCLGIATRLAVYDQVLNRGGLTAMGIVAAAVCGTGLAVWLLRRASHGGAGSGAGGIRVNPLWAVAAMDTICLIAAALALFFIADGYGALYFGLARGLADPLASDVIAFMFIPAALVLALFVTSSGSQSICIDGAGLVVSGPFGVGRAVWDEIESLSLDEQYVIVSRLGIPMPRHLRTNLEITIGAQDTLTLYQPGLKSTARQILKLMRAHAPPRLSPGLDALASAWL